LPARLAQIDILKGLAIIGVLLLHSLSPSSLHDGLTVLYIGQAVPIFVVLLGVNGAASFWQRDLDGLGQLYSREYVLSRFDRLYLPFLAVLVVSYAVGAVKGTADRRERGGPGGGTLPYSGPGNYFITLAFQFAVVFPAYFWAYRRAPVITTVVGFAIAAAFEAAAPHVAAFGHDPYLYAYSAAILRFTPFFALAVVLADRMVHGRGLPGWWRIAGVVGVVYLLIVHGNTNAFALDDRDWRPWGETFVSAFYPAVLVAAGLHWLPRVAGDRFWQVLAALGAASYEIFLVQILYFGLVGSVSAAMLVPGLVICSLIGYAFHLAQRRTTTLSSLFAT
jgi:peptidoglycan/LPS O-acetylase OafA/YrhL